MDNVRVRAGTLGSLSHGRQQIRSRVARNCHLIHLEFSAELMLAHTELVGTRRHTYTETPPVSLITGEFALNKHFCGSKNAAT
jgi:hypothetical protein